MARIRITDTPSPFDVELKMVKPKKLRKERTRESAGNRYAKSLGWDCYKVRFVGQAGFPDRLYMKRGSNKKLWWEWKKVGESPDARQLQRIEELRATGDPVGWSSDIDIFKKAIDEL